MRDEPSALVALRVPLRSARRFAELEALTLDGDRLVERLIEDASAARAARG